jgi:hypothetical protein
MLITMAYAKTPMTATPPARKVEVEVLAYGSAVSV